MGKKAPVSRRPFGTGKKAPTTHHGEWIMRVGKPAMRFFLFLGGVLFVLKGAKVCLAVVDGFASASFGSAYAAGYITGESLAGLAFLAGGIGFILRAARSTRQFP